MLTSRTAELNGTCIEFDKKYKVISYSEDTYLKNC